MLTETNQKWHQLTENKYLLTRLGSSCASSIMFNGTGNINKVSLLKRFMSLGLTIKMLNWVFLSQKYAHTPTLFFRSIGEWGEERWRDQSSLAHFFKSFSNTFPFAFNSQTSGGNEPTVDFGRLLVFGGLSNPWRQERALKLKNQLFSLCPLSQICPSGFAPLPTNHPTEMAALVYPSGTWQEMVQLLSQHR